jgi:hypothetical protein
MMIMEPNDPFTPAQLRALSLGTTLTAVGVWAMAAMAAVIALWPQAPTWLMGGLIAVFLVTLVAALVMFARAGKFRLGRRYAPAARREFFQWDRWQSFLFVFPALMTGLVFIALARVRDWQGGEHDWFNVLWPTFVPLYVIVVAQRFLPEKRRQRPLVRDLASEAYSDELSREQARLAFRAGYIAMALGLAATLVIGLVAPERTLDAVLGAVWLGFTACCVRFGLLQREAEPDAAGGNPE